MSSSMISIISLKVSLLGSLVKTYPPFAPLNIFTTPAFSNFLIMRKQNNLGIFSSADISFDEIISLSLCKVR